MKDTNVPAEKRESVRYMARTLWRNREYESEIEAEDALIAMFSQAIQAAVEEDRLAIYEEVSTEFAKSPLCKRKDRDADKFYLKVLSIIHEPSGRVAGN